MSSIYITSRLHLAWKRSTKQWAAEMRRVTGPDSGFTSVAPRPSQTTPPPEEFGTVLRAVLPYVNHGVNAVTASAIIAANTAGQGVPPSALLPLSYYSGLGAARGAENICLRYSQEWVGCPIVPIEDFPLLSLLPDQSGDINMNIRPFPAEVTGKIVFTGWHGVNFFPKLFRNVSELDEAELRNVHAREGERVATGASGLLVKEVLSGLRYTGCIRPATEHEIDTLFDTVILEGHWVKSVDYNFRDFFSAAGVDSDAVADAVTQTEALFRTPPSSPVSASSVTDVPASRRARRTTTTEDVLDAMATPPVAAPRATAAPGGMFFTGASTSRPLRSTRPSARVPQIIHDEEVFEADEPPPPSPDIWRQAAQHLNIVNNTSVQASPPRQ